MINPEDIRIETFDTGTAWFRCSNGIRITHIPTNTVVICAESPSVFTNKAKAFSLLKEVIGDTTDYLKQLELF